MNQLIGKIEEAQYSVNEEIYADYKTLKDHIRQ
jgi:hypothetical protein